MPWHKPTFTCKPLRVHLIGGPMIFSIVHLFIRVCILNISSQYIWSIFFVYIIMDFISIFDINIFHQSQDLCHGWLATGCCLPRGWSSSLWGRSRLTKSRAPNETDTRTWKWGLIACCIHEAGGLAGGLAGRPASRQACRQAGRQVGRQVGRRVGRYMGYTDESPSGYNYES